MCSLYRRNKRGELQQFCPSLGWHGLPIRGAHNGFQTTGTEWQGHDDDAGEWSANTKAAANTNWTQAVDENFRIRFGIEETGGDTPGNNRTVQLQYNLAGAGWNNVTGSSSVVQASAGNQTDGADTTQQITNGTFQGTNAGTDEADGACGGATMDIGIGEEVEVDFTITIVSGDVVDAQALQLKVLMEGADLTSQPTWPSLTISEPAGATLPPEFQLRVPFQENTLLRM
jgi:hypothetical protein